MAGRTLISFVIALGVMFTVSADTFGQHNLDCKFRPYPRGTAVRTASKWLGIGYGAGNHWRNPGVDPGYYNPYSDHNSFLISNSPQYLAEFGPGNDPYMQYRMGGYGQYGADQYGGAYGQFDDSNYGQYDSQYSTGSEGESVYDRENNGSGAFARESSDFDDEPQDDNLDVGTIPDSEYGDTADDSDGTRRWWEDN